MVTPLVKNKTTKDEAERETKILIQLRLPLSLLTRMYETMGKVKIFNKSEFIRYALDNFIKPFEKP